MFLYSYHAHDRCIDEEDIIIELSFTDSGLIDEILKRYGTKDGIEEDDEYAHESIPRIEIKENIGKLLHTTVDFSWETQYDGSKEDSVVWSVPCSELIDTLRLSQLEYDGFYYDVDKTLSAFDLFLTQGTHAVVIRKNLLDAFLRIKKLKLIWIANFAREIHSNIDLSIVSGLNKHVVHYPC